MELGNSRLKRPQFWSQKLFHHQNLRPERTVPSNASNDVGIMKGNTEPLPSSPTVYSTYPSTEVPIASVEPIDGNEPSWIIPETPKKLSGTCRTSLSSAHPVSVPPPLLDLTPRGVPESTLVQGHQSSTPNEHIPQHPRDLAPTPGTPPTSRKHSSISAVEMSTSSNTPAPSVSKLSRVETTPTMVAESSLVAESSQRNAENLALGQQAGSCVSSPTIEAVVPMLFYTTNNLNGPCQAFFDMSPEICQALNGVATGWTNRKKSDKWRYGHASSNRVNSRVTRRPPAETSSGYACNNCVESRRFCVVTLKDKDMPCVLPLPPTKRNGKTSQDLAYWRV